MAVWDGQSNGTDALYNSYMAASGSKFIRFPGGSWADIVDWSNLECSGSQTWVISVDEALSFVAAFGAKLQPIVNFSGYWCDTQHSHAEAVQKAADWVRNFNVTRRLGVQHWEIGNESFGSWEQGFTNGTDYGNRFADYYNAMKAVDSTIKIGAVVHEDPAAWNSWTPNVLQAAKAKGVIPDFLIMHMYPTSDPMGSAADAKILAAVDQIATYTNSFNSMVSQYLGSQYVGQIPYWMTEYRSALGTQQIITFVDAMFSAQYILEMAKHGWGGATLGHQEWL
jgi:alpha-L-arabinofuranosidase